MDIFLPFFVFVKIRLTCLDWIGLSVFFANLSLLSLSPKPQKETFNRNNDYKPFYTKVDECKQDDAKIKLTNLIQEAFDNKIIE